MSLYKNATHLMALTLTLLVGPGSIEGLMAADQTPREKRHDRRNRRGGLGKSSLRRLRRAEAPAEDAAHTVIEMGEDSLVIEIAYTDGTEESIQLPHFFNLLYKTPCHYTYQNCNCCGILPHKTLDDIEIATIYTYNTERCEYLPHPQFTERFAAILNENRRESCFEQLGLQKEDVCLWLLCMLALYIETLENHDRREFHAFLQEENRIERFPEFSGFALSPSPPPAQRLAN